MKPGAHGRAYLKDGDTAAPFRRFRIPMTFDSRALAEPKFSLPDEKYFEILIEDSGPDISLKGQCNFFKELLKLTDAYLGVQDWDY